MARHAWRMVEAPAAPAPPAPDEAQARVAAWTAGSALVLGAAGTGKTTAIVEAVAARIGAGVPPASVLLVASGRAAAAALRTRLAVRLSGHEAPRVTTFHALALDIVTRTSDADAPRLLTGAEQEREVRDVIAGTLEDAPLRNRWPASLLDALGTRGFAREVRAAFAAARALGLAGDEVRRIGLGAGDEAWAAIGPVLDDYLDVQAQRAALDYAELMFRAVVAVRDPRNAALLRELRHVYVDEYEEADRMQVALLVALSAHGASLVVAADPDQAVSNFRGTAPRQLRDFAEDFPSATVIPLATAHRFGDAIQRYALDVFDGTAPTGMPKALAATHRTPLARPGDGMVRAFLYDDTASEAAHVASAVRELGDTCASWSDIAVIARSTAALAAVERALQRIGVPAVLDVRVGRIVEQPAARTLLRALEAVARPKLRLEGSHAHELLLSPLCGLDASEVRALARRVRTDRLTPSDEALASALAAEHPAFELGADVPGAYAFESLRALLHRAHAQVRSGGTPHDVLWLLWSGTGWPERLRRQALEQGSPLANRDLDAVCELFDIAERTVLRTHGMSGVQNFLYDLLGQDVPSDTLARRGFTGPSVELVTAHGAKGREWGHVFVVGVNEGAWPNLRRRASVLDTDRLDASGLLDARSRQALFDDERRLFHVACTRARETLVVSGVVGERADDLQPSRFLRNRVVPPQPRAGRPTTLDGSADVIAALRRTATSEHASPALRDAAILRLHRLAALRDEAGDALFPDADPRRWWGALPVTGNDVPVQDADAPLYLRGSSLDTLSRCSLEWFLTQRASAETQRGTAVVFGSAVHALADAVVKGELPAEAAVLEGELRDAWNAAGYEAAWQSERDFEEGCRAIARFLHWHGARTGRRVESEVVFDHVVELRTPSGRQERLRMRGSIDRVEITDDGTVVVFDYKTGRSPFSGKDVEASGQLRYYQLAVERGLVGEGLRAGGGAYVMLRLDAGSNDGSNPKVQEQAALAPSDPWAVDVLGAALDVVRDERFVATPGTHCQRCSLRAACPARPEGRVEAE